MLSFSRVITLIFFVIFSPLILGKEVKQTSQDDAKSLFSRIQSIIVTIDKLAVNTNYEASHVSNEIIKPLVSDATLKSPWGTDIQVTTSAQNSLLFTISNTPRDVCESFTKMISLNFSDISTCNLKGTTDIRFTWKDAGPARTIPVSCPITGLKCCYNLRNIQRNNECEPFYLNPGESFNFFISIICAPTKTCADGPNLP